MDLIPVKKSTLATWCREVSLTQEQTEAIKERTGSVAGIPRDTQWKRRVEVEVIRKDAISRMSRLILDPVWMAGIVLYWAEGTKGRNRVAVANSDPNALLLFIHWIRTYIDPQAEFCLQLHLHEGNDDLSAQSHWSAVLGMGAARYHKTFIKPRGTGHRKNILTHGVCTVRLMRAGDAWQVIDAWLHHIPRRLGLVQADD